MLEKFDLYLYRGHYKRHKQHYGLYPHDLPKIPDLLPPYTKATNKDQKVSRRKKARGKAKPKFFSTTSPNPNSCKHKSRGEVSDTADRSPSHEKDIYLAQLETSKKESEALTLTAEAGVAMTVGEKEPEEVIERFEERLVPAIISTNIAQDIFVNTPTKWTYPNKGLWSWYNFLKEKQYPIPIPEYLGEHIQKNVNKLFAPSAAVNYSFKDFRTLWEHVEGKIIEQRGGSHRQLIGPKEEHLFGTWVPHGSDNQAFGFMGVKYLQTAALYVGYIPSED